MCGALYSWADHQKSRFLASTPRRATFLQVRERCSRSRGASLGPNGRAASSDTGGLSEGEGVLFGDQEYGRSAGGYLYGVSNRFLAARRGGASVQGFARREVNLRDAVKRRRSLR